MNTADLITAFFNNEMSPDQERQFLVSVASSDSLRLGMKSHVMLDKILNEQTDFAKAPLNVRTTIMREAAIVAAAGGALSASEALANNSEATSAHTTSTAAVGQNGIRVSRWLSVAMAFVLAIGSFFAGFYTGADSTDSGVETAVAEDAVPSQETEPTMFMPTTASPALVTDKSQPAKIESDGGEMPTLVGTPVEPVASSRKSRSSNVTNSQAEGVSLESTTPEGATSQATMSVPPATNPIGLSINKIQVDSARIPEANKKK